MEKLEDSSGIPSQRELEKEISDYLSKKYGSKVRVVSQMIFPHQLKPDNNDYDASGKSQKEGLPFTFDLRPEELETYLDKYVVKQDQAKAILATKVCTHFNRIAYMLKKGKDSTPTGLIKSNIILIGPTGVGKTFMVKLIAQKLGVPFVKGDATKFSETGYVGGDVEDLVRELVHEANGDIERAQYGIIYIDEIDKIASSKGLIGPDVSRTGVQRALLKPMEETEVELKTPHDPIAQIEAIERYKRTGKRDKRTINTRHILFIVSGAFSGLADIIKKRCQKTGIGFHADIDLKDEIDWLKLVKPQDLVEYGFEQEFIGRLPIIAVLDELEEEDLFEILKNPRSSVILTKKQDFRAYGIDLRFEESALRKMAHLAKQEETGARALVSVVERVLLPFEKKLPSLGIDFLVVTEDMVNDPLGELEKIIKDPHNPKRREQFEAILKEEEETYLLRLEREGVKIWQELDIPLTKVRQQMITQLMVREDMDLDEAEEKVRFLIQQAKSYEENLYNRCGIKIKFEEDAIDFLIQDAIGDTAVLYERCERVINILEYGLPLVFEKSGKAEFLIPVEGVENPEGYVNKLIRQSL
ncbi:ATP-dependent Clp protease ATP-binding subunit ClpX [Dissulfuribacter thermophilus]|uniref:ATP-dependent Clp protease ATP-binding subunit ClpX n=1 Tax=Dissulfuribacter thermophilus TaxID=1156395 RepID=A0A1B9F688_9BACT|nr:AAA family ATPase [Dissulfuribacter thermophilus]OCC15432.1 ATP-dependent Clp protease ATP-binding subunit ClpX [Dissulfuribacter thermophilus]